MFRVKEGIMNNIIKKADKNKQFLLALGLFFVLANLFVVYFISQEKFIYFWDILNYWKKTAYLCEYIFTDTLSVIKTVVYSIREDNYNYLPALFLVPFGLLFGTSRLAYILSIVNMYALPVVVSFVVLLKKLNTIQERPSVYLPLIAVGVLLFSPIFWSPIISGFPDVGGVFLINLILLLYFKNSFARQDLRVLFLIALCISLLMLFRRWYIFWGVAFYAVLFMEICAVSLLTRPFSARDLARSLLKFLGQVSCSAIVFFAAAPTLARRILGTDYTDMNSAYRASANLFESLEFVIKSFGLFYFVLFVLGAIYAVIDKKLRKFAIFLLAHWVVMFVLFARTQDFDAHHFYLLLPVVVIFSSLFLAYFFDAIKKFKIIAIGCVTLIFVLNFWTAFGLDETRDRKAPPGLFTINRQAPLVRHDIQEVEKILITLQELLTQPGDRVYVLASSDALNPSILDSAYMHFGRYKDICKKVYKTHDIDKRHGFPRDLLKAQYVIVADPVQYHMRPKDQQVMGIPAGLFLENKGIASSFEKLPYEFVLEGNVKVYFYKKVKPIQDADVADLSEMLRQYYPDNKNVYEIKEK